MLIINADDYGRNRLSTHNILECFKKDRITSTSLMVFMEYSQKAAELTLDNELDVGLHLNFTEKYNGRLINDSLVKHNEKISTYLSRSKLNYFIYNPLLKRHFEYVFKTQYDEYIRLYNRIPSHIDGHRHMHLCMNMIVDEIIPKGSIVRQSHYFFSDEKNSFNRAYRYIINRLLRKKYICTNFFFDIYPFDKGERLLRIIDQSKISNVELMVHPERSAEYKLLMSDKYLGLIANADTIKYSDL